MVLYLKNATYVDYNSFEFKSCNIKVTENRKIEFIENLPAANERDRVIDCHGKIVTKSFACGHHHAYSALARGMGGPSKTPTNFHEILQYVWWTLDKSLDLEMIEASALVTAISSAKKGVTFVIDHHASPFAAEGSLETIAKAFDRVGVSHLLAYELSDRDGDEVAKKALDESENYLKSGRQGLVGLHAGFTVGESLLENAVQLASKYNSGIHVHVAEDLYDQKMSIENYGQRVIERFGKAGVLDFSKTILAHCLHLSENEKSIIKNSNAWIAENMESNLNNGVGLFSGEGLGSREQPMAKLMEDRVKTGVMHFFQL